MTNRSTPAKPPMAAPNLDQAIQQYATALERLVLSRNSSSDTQKPIAPSSPNTAEARTSKPPSNQPTQDRIVFDVLIARDRLQAALEAFSTSADCLPPVESLKQISDLDTRLKEQAVAIAPLSADWRTSFNPDEKAWWWFSAAPAEPLDWLWNAVSIACLTASLTLIGDSAPRFFAGGPDLLSSFFLSLQSVGTLASAGAILKGIEETTQRASTKLKTSKLRWQKLSAGISAFLLITVWALRLDLPSFSNLYTESGQENYQKGDWSSAEADYKRALQLNPDNAETHFRLGLLYENLQNFDAAHTQYQLAMQGDIPDVTNTATNNLARLKILKKDYPAAVSLLLKALDPQKKSPLDLKTKHAVLKNLGWARLKQGNSPDTKSMLGEAKTRLEEAIKLQSTLKLERAEIAAPHCLLAQVMDAQGDKKGALTWWNNCNKYANMTIPEQDEWAAIARKRIAEESLQ